MRQHEIDETLERAKDRAFRAVAALNACHELGGVDDDEWHCAMAALIREPYLNAATPQGGSGHSGSARDWEWSRGLVIEAIDRDGSFLDVGCANGLLIESVERWAAAAGRAIEGHGLDIVPELAARARERLPQLAGRIHVGNALGWEPPRRYELVRTGLEYVPPRRRPELVRWLLERVVAPGGRLIIGKYNEELAHRALEHDLSRWGFTVAGRAERAHRAEPRIAYRCVWIDAPP